MHQDASEIPITVKQSDVPNQTLCFAELREWITRYLAARAGVATSVLDPGERFQRLGLDSLGATAMLLDLGVMLGRLLSPTLVWEYPTPEALARHLAGSEVVALAAAVTAVERRMPDEPIAIVGMACRFPQAPSPEAFWALLRDGVDAITEAPKDRWDVQALYDADLAAPGKLSTKWGGFLSEVDSFDPGFFGISPREAVQIDPQQRLALELAWEALEDARIPPAGLRGSPTGVFFGAMWMDYARLLAGAGEGITQHTATGQDLSIVPARISYALGLNGPSLVVNTACSSSLVAVHLACQSLLRGESRLALVGGVNLLLSPESTIAMSKFGAMAPDGRSKAFDARANGYVRGEGGGVVVLKRLSDAQAAGDRIYCTIRGTAVNNDGFSNGLTAPSPQAQEAVLRAACAAAGVAPTAIAYVEAHGTGTMLGDPIEAGALGAVMGAGRPTERALRIGSVKTNIGHLEAAAGIAGLIKVALSMHKRALPPSLHFERPNPHIPFPELKLQVQTKLAAWEAEDGRLLAGVSSFGFGGTNCHVVLEASPLERPCLFVLSAEEEAGLRAKAQQQATALRQPDRPALETVCAAAARQAHAPFRLSVLVRSPDELGRQLHAFAEGQPLPGLASGRARRQPPKVAFVFGGQGSQWLGMGAALLADEPAARAVLEQCDRAFRRHVSWSLIERLTRGDAAQLEQTDFVQPAIFALQLALAAAWRARRLVPDAVIGQSMGEVAAACVAGALGLADAAQVICQRSQLVTRTRGNGGMAVVGLSLQATAEALSPFGGRLTVAVSSSPEMTVVAGDEGALAEMLAAVQARGVFSRTVRVDYASHSSQMDSLLPELRQTLRGIAPRRSQIEFYSTVTAAPLDGAALGAEYWARNLREPVMFAPALRRLIEDGIEIFVEVNPHPVLAQAIEQSLAYLGRPGTVVTSARRDGREPVTLLETAGRLLVAGVPTTAEDPRAALEPPAELLVLSAHSEAAQRSQAARLQAHLQAHPELALADIAYSLATTRSAMAHRLAITTNSRATLQEALVSAAQAQTHSAARSDRIGVGPVPKVVFVFPGQGSQWLGMGQELLAQEPVFRETLVACDRAIFAEAGFSILAELAAPEACSQLQRIEVVQPLLFALGVALAALWRSWGVQPDAVVGHSMGEVAAAHVADAISLTDAVAIICRRSRLLRRISGHGEMAMVELSLAEAERTLEGYESCLSVAVSNSPRSTVLSGEPAALAEVLGRLEQKGVFCRRVKVDVASHSPQVAPLQPELAATLALLAPREVSIAMLSTVTGADVQGPELGADYWAANLRQPVRFAEAVQRLVDRGHGLFLEMSPHPTLVPAVEEILQQAQRGGLAVGSLRRGQPERAALRTELGALWTKGYPLAWEKLFPSGGSRVSLPTYPWQRERYWVEPPRRAAEGSPQRRQTGGHPLLGETMTLSTQTTTQLWETTLDLERLPWLADHRVQGAVLLPGAAYLEMALWAGSAALGREQFEVLDVALVEALVLAADSAVSVQLVTTQQQPGHLRFQVASRVPGVERVSYRVNARGRLQRISSTGAEVPFDLAAVRARMSASDLVDAYAGLVAMGLQYGASFRGITHLWRGESEALGRIQLPLAAGSPGPYLFHPALLDACLQVMAATLAQGGETTPWVPIEVGSVRLMQRPRGELFCHVRMSRPESAGATARGRADLWVVDGTGAGVVRLTGLVMQRLARDQRHGQQDDWFLRQEWETLSVPAPKPAAGRWLLLGGGGGLGAALRAALQTAGQAVVHMEDNHPRLGVFLKQSFAGNAPTAVVHLGSLDADKSLDARAVERGLVHGYDSAMATVQALVGLGLRDAPRLWLVTRGAQALPGSEVAVVQAPLLGLGRVIALEHGELRCARIDLDPSCPADEVSALVAELLADDEEEELALRGAQRRVARLTHRRTDSRRQENLVPAQGRPFRLELDTPGILDDLVLRAAPRRAAGPGEVEIAVEAAGLNFMDVMKALGTHPGREDGAIALGGECAGRVVAVGQGVKSLRVGQEVVAVAPFSFGTHVTAEAGNVAPRPAGLSAAQAAALPLVFMTAWYGLVHLGQLRAGERVLIHSATGGTGLAAVQIARYLGAEVLATAGTEKKRAWLREQGIGQVMDSRSLEFAEQVMAATGGQGVDVVLNSLAGEAIEASLSALAADGRFIELGKTDIYNDRSLGLAHFKKSLSYSAVDLAGLAERRPGRFTALLTEVMGLFAQGVLQALPVQCTPISRASEAFRKMAQGQHLGKLVLTLDDPEVQVRIPIDSKVAIRTDASYLVTGGLGGLGLHAAAWLAAQGAGHLILVGRSGAQRAEQEAAIAAMIAKGTRVTVAMADVAQRAQLEKIFVEIADSAMPLRGVIHAAGLLDDGLLMQQTPARLRKVLLPKALGALHLHELTKELLLDFFVLYASAAGLLGSPGQGNYAAANTFLDALAHYRSAQGLPALSVDWSAFSEVGLAAVQDNRGARLAFRGMRSLTPNEGLEALKHLLEAGDAQVGVVPLNLRQWAGFHQRAAASPRLSRLWQELRSDNSQPTGERPLLDRLAAAEPAARTVLVAEALRTQVAQVLRIPESKLDAQAPLTSLGLDSLMGLELRNRIESVFGIRVSATLLWKYSTMAAVTEHLAGNVGEPAAPEPAPAGAHASADIGGLASLSEQESARLIDEEFEALI